MTDEIIDAGAIPEESAPGTEDSEVSGDAVSPPSPERNISESDTERIVRAFGLEGVSTDDFISMVDSRRMRRELAAVLKEASAAENYERLYSDARRFASEHEGFDIRGELSDRRFVSMLRSGFSFEEAYNAVHFDELLSSAVENAEKKAMASALARMKENALRPDENGTGGTSPAKTSQDVRSLTGKGIRDILRRVEKGAKVRF